MSKGLSLQRLDGRTAVVAFDGWNDAGDAATAAVRSLLEHDTYRATFSVDEEDYFDYQYARPVAETGADGTRKLIWPSVKVYSPKRDDLPLVVIGTEPARRWQRLAKDLVAAIAAAEVSNVVLIGSMLADTPHTRPIMVSLTSEQADVRSMLECERSQYEGPVGILSAVADTASVAGMRTVSMWASVPHYVPANAPAPKATLALLTKLGEIINAPLPDVELERDANRWEASLDAALSEDEDLSLYVKQLERARDAWDSPEASGDAIAQEFERFLRRDEGGNGKRPHGG